MEATKRSEIHLVTRITSITGKTPGVKKGSNLFVQVNARLMHEDGIGMYISEGVDVVFTRGAACSTNNRSIVDVIDPKYFKGMTTAQGDELLQKVILKPREAPRRRMPSNENERPQVAAAAPSRIALQSASPPVSTSVMTYVAKQKQIIEDRTGAALSLFGGNTAVAAPCKSPPASIAVAAPCKSPPASMPPPPSLPKVASRAIVEKAPPLRAGPERSAARAGRGKLGPVTVAAVP